MLTVTQMLRKQGVVGKFVEFYGPGLDHLSVADKATIGNMAPEYGATCGFFPIDSETINYLRFTGRDEARVQMVEAYAKVQGMWRDETSPDPVFTDTLELDLNTIEPSMAGPKRPQDRVALSGAAAGFNDTLKKEMGAEKAEAKVAVAGADYSLSQGDVVIAAITSCTNTSNPSVMLAAGLLAKKAVAKGLKTKPWVKTSLAPGSQVVTDYLLRAGVQEDLNTLGFNLVGYGCTTCIGNSGPLAEPIENAIKEGDLTVAGVLSGNRNFEGRIHAFVKANYLASPPLVVAYALAGSMKIDLLTEPLGMGSDGKPVFLKDIWPTQKEIRDTLQGALTQEMFKTRYANVFHGGTEWQNVKMEGGLTYNWDSSSTYVQNPPYFATMTMAPEAVKDIESAYALAVFGDSITTDHISPAGSIKKDSPAGSYLMGYQVRPVDFNSYGARRGNHEVMMRGTFANIRIKNEMLGGKEGGLTRYIPTGEEMPIYDAAMKYIAAEQPLIIVAGKEYGTGSSRDWAAKGTKLLGIRAVIAESFERIHRSNLVGMGVLPLQFKEGTTRATLGLKGDERYDIGGIALGLAPRMDLNVTIHYADGRQEIVKALCRIDTLDEIEYFKNGGILQYVLRGMAKAA